jgi:hypothetical protein
LSDLLATLRRLMENGLPAVAIAGILRTDRKTVRAWLDGAAEDAAAAERLATVCPLIEDAFGSNLKTVFRLWNTKDRGGVSLGELLSAETVDIEAAKGYLAFFDSAIRRYAAQDAAPQWPSARGGNPLIDECPAVDLGNW